MTASYNNQPWSCVQFGAVGTLQYRAVFQNQNGEEVSSWHDLHHLDAVSGQHNFVCSTPKTCWLDMEISENEPFTPLRLRQGLGRPRHFSDNCPVNFGFLAQTLCSQEQEVSEFPDFKYVRGPLTVAEIGAQKRSIGEVYPVKPLSSFFLIDDQARLFPVLVAMACSDSEAELLEGPNDVIDILPGALAELKEWLRHCRCVFDYDVGYKFGMNERPSDSAQAHRLIADSHASWQLMEPCDWPMPSWDMPSGRHRSPNDYDQMWEIDPDRISVYTLPWSAPIQTPSSNPDKAWASPIRPDVWGEEEEGEEEEEAIAPIEGGIADLASHSRQSSKGGHSRDSSLGMSQDWGEEYHRPETKMLGSMKVKTLLQSVSRKVRHHNERSRAGFSSMGTLTDPISVRSTSVHVQWEDMSSGGGMPGGYRRAKTFSQIQAGPLEDEEDDCKSFADDIRLHTHSMNSSFVMGGKHTSSPSFCSSSDIDSPPLSPYNPGTPMDTRLDSSPSGGTGGNASSPWNDDMRSVSSSGDNTLGRFAPSWAGRVTSPHSVGERAGLPLPNVTVTMSLADRLRMQSQTTQRERRPTSKT